MSLKKAAAYYNGGFHYFNALWEKIGQPFGDYICCGFERKEFMEELYCSEREFEGEGYIKEDEVLEYVNGDAECLLLLLGETGVGKTTFLKRVLGAWPSVVWLDFLRMMPANSSPEEVVRELWMRVNSRLRERRGDGNVRSLDDFIIHEMPDEDGRIGYLREQSSRGNGLVADDQRMYVSLVSQFKAQHKQAYARLLIRYHRQILGQRPVLVLDNLDQLPQDSIAAIVEEGKFFADSSQPDRHDDSMKVVAAVRAGTWQHKNARTRTWSVSHVAPPKLSKVLKLRVDAFLKRSPQKVLEGTKGIIVNGKTFELPKHLLKDQSITDLGKHLIEQLCSALGKVRLLDNETMGLRIHRMCNNNTRQSLVAFAGYSESNHLPLVEIVRAFQRAEDWERAEKAVEDIVGASASRLMRALVLGPAPVFGHGGHTSWVVNLLNDGNRADQASLLVRPYTMKALTSLDNKDAVESVAVIELLRETAGFSPDRVEECLDQLHRSYSLIDDLSEKKASRPSERKVRINDAGRKYLTLLRDFDGYLRFVTTDVWVRPDNLRECRSIEEPDYEVLLRVMGVCREVRNAEVHVVESALRRGAETKLRSWLNEDLVCRAIASGINSKLESLSLGKDSDDEKRWLAFNERLTAQDVLEDARRMASEPQELASRS